MIELVMMVAAVVGMARISAAEDMSGFFWGGITAVACIAAAALLPWPMLRIVVVVVVMLCVWMGVRMAGHGRR
jgi:hypothetical protein